MKRPGLVGGVRDGCIRGLGFRTPDECSGGCVELS